MGNIDPCVKLGRRVRYLRTLRGITQDQLAGLAGLSRGQLSRIENGHQECGVRLMLSIAQALGVKVSELVQTID